MDHIYSSLYDLFNQNFATFGDKRYCRIALGALLNPKCYVHEHFHSIIYMSDDDEALKKADAPFLNRFEKHYIKLESILSEKEAEVVRILEIWVSLILTLRINNEANLLRATNVFPNYSNDTLGLLAMKYNDREDLTVNDIVRRCKEDMI